MNSLLFDSGVMSKRLHQPKLRAKEAGFTLVELLVALALSSLIAIAAIASLIVSRQGFKSLDSASQIRDNGRFAADLIQRLVVQAGFQDAKYAAATQSSQFAVAGSVVPPSVLGIDNVVVSSVTNLPSILTSGSGAAFTTRSTSAGGCSSSTDTACLNNSDALVLRYQSAEGAVGSGVADGSMINCAGASETVAPINKDDQMVSVFHVARGLDGEPSLMCSYRTSSSWASQPLVQGVESFQVLYGVDGFTTVNTKFTGAQDTVPDKYLRATQMVVAGNAESADTYSNWQRVRSLRIGLVLRGPANSALVKGTNVAKLCPLGFDPDATAADIAAGTAACVDASGSEFPPTTVTVPDDGRMRQVLTFTVYLRNVQNP